MSADFQTRALTLQFVHEARKRETDGLVKYGDFDPRTDKRNLSREAIEEALDAFNYLDFLSRKFPQLKDECKQIQAIACRLYIRLRAMEQREQQLTHEGRHG